MLVLRRLSSDQMILAFVSQQQVNVFRLEVEADLKWHDEFKGLNPSGDYFVSSLFYGGFCSIIWPENPNYLWIWPATLKLQAWRSYVPLSAFVNDLIVYSGHFSRG